PALPLVSPALPLIRDRLPLVSPALPLGSPALPLIRDRLPLVSPALPLDSPALPLIRDRLPLVSPALPLDSPALPLAGRDKLPLVGFSSARHTSSMHPTRGEGTFPAPPGPQISSIVRDSQRLPPRHRLPLSAVGADDYRECMRADNASMDGQLRDLYAQADAA